MNRKEAYDQLYNLKGYPLEFQDGLYPLFEKINVLIMNRMTPQEKEVYFLDPDLVLSYLVEEHVYNYNAIKEEIRDTLLTNPSYLERMSLMICDKIYINEFHGYGNNTLLSKYHPLVTTYTFFLNFILNRFNALERSNDLYTSVFLDVLKKGFEMSKGVMCLLTSGFETEAFSTWRTIHETECIAKILFDRPYLIATYIKHIEYARYYRSDNGDKEKQDQLFREIKESMKEVGLKSKDMKKFVEYGYLYSIKNINQEFPEFKPNFRKGVELVAGLSEYSATYELSSEIAHSSPLLIYSNRLYFRSLCLINIYDTFFRLEKILYEFLKLRDDIDSGNYFKMREDYLVELKKNIQIEKAIFSLSKKK